MALWIPAYLLELSTFGHFIHILFDGNIGADGNENKSLQKKI